jgi:two-component system sensor histidine kinase VicK
MEEQRSRRISVCKWRHTLLQGLPSLYLLFIFPAYLTMSSPTEKNLLLEEEIAALREEIQQLRTERVEAQAHQAHSDDKEEQEARFHTIFENSPFGQKIITPDLVIRQANQAVVEMLGCTDVEDLVGRKIMEFAHPDHKEDWRFLQKRLWNHKLPSFTLETCLIRTDGSSFWCQVTSIRFPNGDEELGYTLLEDISDRKTLELSLKRLYDAQETILHLVSHDLKTPIAHIELLTDLLQRQLEAPEMAIVSDKKEIPQFLELIRRACADASKLLRDVLFLGSLDAAHIKKQPTNLHTLVEERLQTHRLAAQDKEIELILKGPPQNLVTNLNADIFGRAVDNLVSNALKFTPAGGRITLGLEERAGKTLLTVQDTGIGIPEALQTELFEKFSSSARPGIAGETSTGLGLFITRQIVQLHRGKIWVESQENVGTTFYIEFPITAIASPFPAG